MKHLKIALMVAGMVMPSQMHSFKIQLNTGTCLAVIAASATGIHFVTAAERPQTFGISLDQGLIVATLITPVLLFYYANSPAGKFASVKHLGGTIIGFVQFLCWALPTKMVCTAMYDSTKTETYNRIAGFWTTSMALCSAVTVYYANQCFY